MMIYQMLKMSIADCVECGVMSRKAHGSLVKPERYRPYYWPRGRREDVFEKDHKVICG